MNPFPQPIRVMRIITRLIIGGPTIQAVNLNAALNGGAYQSLLVTGKGGKDESDQRSLALQRGISVSLIPELGRDISPKCDLAALWKLYRLMRLKRPHIVHTHTAKAGFLGRLAARLARVPVVCHTFHGHCLNGYFNAAANRVLRVLERCAARLTDRLITLSPALKRELVALGVAEPEHVAVIPLGLDLQAFACQERLRGVFRRELGLKDDARLIGMVGRLVKIKNVPLLLQAAARLKDRLPNLHVAIIGDGEERPNLEKQCRQLNLEELVHFTGWRHDLPQIYADLDAALITSDNEGTPVSLIEAMASGCPVVSTRVGGVPDLLEEGRLGLLVPPRDAETLARAILYLLQNKKETLARAASARSRVIQKCTTERLVSDIESLYRQLLSAKLTRTDSKRMTWS
ncbi:MAG: glycosyltransferase family 4 protein [Deltaproteobacteria bacterium]|nr:glycosyltransferase family 4 protein [Deltaproteobacteria bacterium]